jgi:hypothetical protein
MRKIGEYIAPFTVTIPIFGPQIAVRLMNKRAAMAGLANAIPGMGNDGAQHTAGGAAIGSAKKKSIRGGIVGIVITGAFDFLSGYYGSLISRDLSPH